jgi:hypothetical protein
MTPIRKTLLTAGVTVILALLSGCAGWSDGPPRPPSQQEITNSIEMGRFPKTAESRD